MITLPFFCFAQEEHSGIYINGKKYLDLNLKAQEKCSRRISHQQDRLLKKLKKKEARYAQRLKHKDSASYARYQQQPLTYDSISKLRKNDSSSVFKRVSNRRNAGIDSLRGVKRFIDDKAHVTGPEQDNKMAGYNDRLQKLQAEQAKQQATNELIDRRTENLKNTTDKSKVKIGGLTTIQKHVFYGKGKMSAFKGIADEPSKAEQKALEYLQGQDGFENYLNDKPKLSFNSMSNSKAEETGFQTNKMMESALKERFGGTLTNLQKSMGKQVGDFNKHTQKLKEASGKLKTVKQLKGSTLKPNKINKPEFKTNPMRCLPFGMRIEKQFNYQTVRATASGDPATFQLSYMIGFKHTASLTYGIGINSSTGLGNNWSTIRFSFEGIGLRTFARWKWQYGFSAYGGYERIFKRALFAKDRENELPSVYANTHNTSLYNEAIVLGVCKNYNLSNKWTGEVQLLYDAWWRDKGLRTPIQIRFATIKK